MTPDLTPLLECQHTHTPTRARPCGAPQALTWCTQVSGGCVACLCLCHSVSKGRRIMSDSHQVWTRVHVCGHSKLESQLHDVASHIRANQNVQKLPRRRKIHSWVLSEWDTATRQKHSLHISQHYLTIFISYFF